MRPPTAPAAPTARTAGIARFPDAACAEAGGYVLTLAGALVAVALVFHPIPRGGFEERPSVLQDTPWWGPIHVAIAAGFVGCVLGGLLLLLSGGPRPRRWAHALAWGALTVGMVYFTGVALINGWVTHRLAPHAAAEPLLFDAMNQLLIGFGWLGNPLFLAGLTAVAVLELRDRALATPRWVAWGGAVAAVLSWLRGVGSATGLYFLEPFIFANVPAFLWLAYYGFRAARLARREAAAA